MNKDYRNESCRNKNHRKESCRNKDYRKESCRDKNYRNESCKNKDYRDEDYSAVQKQKSPDRNNKIRVRGKGREWAAK